MRKYNFCNNNLIYNDDENHPSLQKLFILASVISVLVIPIIVGFGVFSIYRHHIIRHAIKDSRKVGYELLENHFPFLTSGDPTGESVFLSVQDIKKLNRDILEEIRRYHMVNSIVKVKLYSKDKKIIYSNDNVIIGRIDRGNKALEKTLQGKFVWGTTKKGEILDFNDEIKFNIDVVETYIPIEDVHHNIVGAVELYFDISGDRKEIKEVVAYSSGSAFLFLVFLFGGMFIFLERANIAQKRAKQAAQLANEQRLLDEEIHQHSTITAVGELASSIAHQVNNPIAVALTRMAYIKKKTDSFRDLGELKDDFVAVKNQIEGVAEIMKMILHGSTHWMYTPREIRIADIISRIIPLLELRVKNRNINITTSVEPTDLSLEADPVLLEQILVNISNNATDAIIEKNVNGIVSIKSYNFDNDYVCIEIKDDGIGMEQKDMNKIFKSFYSTKKGDKGTGLGLAIAKRLVERHEGRIEVESVPQVGSTFRVILPINVESMENRSL